MKQPDEDKFYKDLAKNVIGAYNNLTPLAQNLINNHYKRLKDKYTFLVESGDRTKETMEEIKKEYRENVDTLVNELLNSKEYKTELYLSSYNKVKEIVDKGKKSWGEILSSEIYIDSEQLNEIFVRLVEEQEGVKITSVKQLQELTGITEIGDNKKTAKQEALRELEDTFIKAMSYRYSFTLEGILNAGGGYSDLLVVEPKDFNLPETWSNGIAKDKKSMVLYAIASEFFLGETAALHPNIRDIAKELEAPYSIILEATNNETQWK